MYGRDDLDKREWLARDSKMSGVKTVTEQAHPEEMHRYGRGTGKGVHGGMMEGPRHDNVEIVMEGRRYERKR